MPAAEALAAADERRERAQVGEHLEIVGSSLRPTPSSRPSRVGEFDDRRSGGCLRRGVLAAALVEAALGERARRVQRGLHGGFAEADHELRLARRQPAPSAMSSVDRQAVQLDGDRRVGARDRDRLHRAAGLAQAAPSFATAACEQAGFVRVDARSRLQFDRPAAAREQPGGAHPAGEVVLRSGRCRRRAPDSGVRIPSSRPFTSKPQPASSVAAPAPEEPPSEPTSEARPCSACTSLRDVAPTLPRPTASHDSPGSSPSAWAPSEAEPEQPPPARRGAGGEACRRRARSSSAEGTSEMFAVRAPASSPTRPPRPALHRRAAPRAEAAGFRVDVGERAGRGAREQLRVAGGVRERGPAERGVDHAVQARDAADHGQAVDDRRRPSPPGSPGSRRPGSWRRARRRARPAIRGTSAALRASLVSSTIAPWTPERERERARCARGAALEDLAEQLLQQRGRRPRRWRAR